MRADEVEQVAREQGVDGSPVVLRQPAVLAFSSPRAGTASLCSRSELRHGAVVPKEFGCCRAPRSGALEVGRSEATPKVS